jgi:hypothetical protein
MTTNGITEKFLAGLDSKELLLKLTWDEWLTVPPPYANREFTLSDRTVRFRRNGYDWDMHGTLFSPQTETDPRRAFVFFHGGAGSEKIMDLTPDGRPGLARALAAQGFKVLALTYPGHYPPGGIWKQPVAERNPIYLMDRDLPEDEIRDRNLKCTFNVILQGAGQLTDENFAGREIIAFGHSTGGPMAAHLTRFSKETKVIGIVGFGSGGPDGWRKEWRDTTGAEKYVEKPIDHVARRSPDSFKESGYHRSGRFDALGWRRRLHSTRQPAALTDENQSVRQSTQRRRGHSRRVRQADRPASRGIFRPFTGS